jgi:hypothetical protein
MTTRKYAIFRTLRQLFAYLDAVGKGTEEREVDAYLATAKTLADLERNQREIERGSSYTHILSGW